MTVLTIDGTQPVPAAGGLVEFRGPDGAVVGQFKLVAPTPLEVEMGISEEKLHRELNDPNTVWLTNDEVRAMTRGILCSK